MNGGVVAII